MPAKGSTSTRDSRRSGLNAACAACAVGLLYAAVSFYWGAGGTLLLDTLGGQLARLGRAHDPGVIALVWAAGLLKMLAALLPLLAILELPSSHVRVVRRCGWVAACILTAYGLALTAVGLLVQARVIPAAAHADRRALAWHAYVWDPWFLAWGGLALTALRRSQPAVR
jgi:hypothetical protein